MKRVVVDPVNRLEGHLRVEVEVDEASGKVQDALSSGTAWRGVELITTGRDPRDAWMYVQRICGVCTTVHAISALRSAEDALGITVPKNANFIRNIIIASQCTQDHLMHFYHLHALDWVSPVEALKADPVATASLQNAVLDKYVLNFSGPRSSNTDAYPKEFPKATVKYFAAVQDKVKKMVESGQLGIFAAHYWDHPDYTVLPPEVHLMAVSHYLNMLDKAREMVVPHVVFGGKNPHPHFVVGGMPCSISMNDMNAPINSERLAAVDNSINLSLNLINYFYLPDLLAIGSMFVQKGFVDGGGLAKERVLGYGEFPEGTFTGIANGDYHKNLLYNSNGVVENFAQGVDKAVFTNVEGKDFADPAVFTEGVDHGWYSYPQGGDLHPWDGVTKPNYTAPKEGTKTNWKYLNEQGKYSWLKTPKWNGKLAEVGPLARYIIIYTKVKQGIIQQPTWVEKMIVDQIDTVSTVLGVPAHVWMLSTAGRTAIRGLEAQVMANVSKYYFDKLIDNIKAGDTAVANSAKWEPSTWPKEAKGVGIHEAPRGALAHYMVIKDGKISNYQAVVPSTWNACPRDENGKHGAYEASLIDTKVKIADKPLEVLRAIHAFDPCLACATHVYNSKKDEVAVVETSAYPQK